MRDYTTTTFGISLVSDTRFEGNTYVEAGIHCGSGVQVPNDTLQSTSSREIGEERRMLPMRDARHNEILEIIRDDLNILPFDRRGG